MLSEEIKLTKPVCEEQDVNELVNAMDETSVMAIVVVLNGSRCN